MREVPRTYSKTMTKPIDTVPEGYIPCLWEVPVRDGFYDVSILGLVDGRICRKEDCVYYNPYSGKWDIPSGTVTHWRERVPDAEDIEEFQKREREARLWSLQT